MGLLQRIFGKERRVFSTRASSREQAKALRTKDETTAALRSYVAKRKTAELMQARGRGLLTKHAVRLGSSNPDRLAWAKINLSGGPPHDPPIPPHQAR